MWRVGKRDSDVNTSSDDKSTFQKIHNSRFKRLLLLCRAYLKYNFLCLTVEKSNQDLECTLYLSKTSSEPILWLVINSAGRGKYRHLWIINHLLRPCPPLLLQIKENSSKKILPDWKSEFGLYLLPVGKLPNGKNSSSGCGTYVQNLVLGICMVFVPYL